MDVKALYDPSPDDARTRPRLVNRGAALGWVFQHRGEAFRLLAELEMRPAGAAAGLSGRVVLRPGERRRMCWSALDALLRLDEMGCLHAPREDFLRERDAVREAIETQGFRAALDGGGSYVGAFGEDWADASLLIMARIGFHDPNHPRIVGTADRIWCNLERGALLLRYWPEVDGLGSREGAFGICGFWAVELLALKGRLDEADALFWRAASLANDVGLLAEEYDPESGAALGNVPQAFTHAGLISAALMLVRAKETHA